MKEFLIDPDRFCELNRLTPLQARIVKAVCYWHESGSSGYKEIVAVAKDVGLFANLHLGRKIKVVADDELEASDHRARQRP